MDNLPAIKWFSPTDVSQGGPFPVTCDRVDRTVIGGSWREWISWKKLTQIVDEWHF